VLNDAADQVLRSRFFASETSPGHLELLWQTAEKAGIPVSIYPDRYSAFRRHDSHGSLEEELAGTPEYDPSEAANKNARGVYA
jgi:hypothetical protein